MAGEGVTKMAVQEVANTPSSVACQVNIFLFGTVGQMIMGDRPHLAVANPHIIISGINLGSIDFSDLVNTS